MNKQLPIERTVLKFNGELEIERDLGYGEEIVVVLRARVGAPAFTALKKGLKQIHKADLADLHIATDGQRPDLEMLLDGGSQLPLPFEGEAPDSLKFDSVSDLDTPADWEKIDTVLKDEREIEYDPEPAQLPSSRPVVGGSRDPILANFLEAGQ